ncbi:MAG TPA: hypothetical protein VHW01_11600 [Polyangiaceae bacterium]|jgi:hypothetical protein|nr:hypothetical protein [Polyangiaceae bacterium]
MPGYSETCLVLDWAPAPPMLASAYVMSRNVRGLERQIRKAALWAVCAAFISTLAACAPAAGGAVLVGIVGIGALTSHCYDYLDVTVFDAQGRRTCAATVTARNGGEHFELSSCYYAPLTDGVWTLSASLPGYRDATTTVPVEHANDCTRHVQSVELTLNAPGSASAPRAAVSLPLPPLPPPASSPPPAAPPTLPAPPAAPLPSTAPPAPPASSAVTPVGVFPETK